VATPDLPSAEQRVQRLAGVIDGADVGVLDTLTDGRVAAGNPAAERIFGIPAGGLVGRDVRTLFPDSCWPEVSEAGALVHAGEKVDVVRTAAFGPGQSLVDVTLRLAPVRDAAGTIIGVSAFIRDVTDEMRARRQLEASERRFRARYDESPMPQAMLALDGRITSANAAMRRLLGRDDVEGTSILALRHPQDAAPPQKWVRSLGKDWHGGSSERVVMLTDGTALPLLVHGAALREADGSVTGLAVFAQDLTRLRQAERAANRAAAVAQAIGNAASDWAVILDSAGRMSYVSPGAQAVLGYDPMVVTGDSAYSYAHPEDVAAARAAAEDVIKDPEVRRRFLLRMRHADGHWLWTEQLLSNQLADPDIAGVVCNGRDVTERIEAEQALERSESRFRAIAETAHEGIWAVDPEGRTLYGNARLLDILGVDLATVCATPAPRLLAPQDEKLLAERLRQRQAVGSERYEVTYPHPDGRSRVLSLSVSPLADDHGPVGSLAMISDVTDERRADEELRRRALHDDLTGLPNRTLLTDRLGQALVRQERLGSGPVALLFADLDQFKLVNDSWGHDCGDELLVAVAQRLAAAVGPGDTVARFGGDEFVVLSEGTDEASARELADHLLAQLAEPFEISGRRAYLSASIGISMAPPAEPDEMLRHADAAMYKAKGSGRGRVAVFDRALAGDAAERLQLGNDLREALAADQLELHYQPIVELSTGRVLGVEALARWHHPERGDVPPSRFVAVAESVGLAPQLDRWALARARRDLGRIRQQLGADVKVNVNISARHLIEGDLEAAVRDELGRGGTPPQGIVLELTESTVMGDRDDACAVLQRLVDLGVTVAVDDFGTGYSSLSYLSRLPVSTLKIDRSFIQAMTRDADSLAIAASVVDLGKTLRMTTVAEGVETSEQLELLQTLGCSAGQGYLWAPPLPLEELATAMRELPVGRFDTSSSAQGKRPAVRQEVVTAEHGLTRLAALHRDGASLSTIAAALNAEGFRTPSGMRWHRARVARAISDLAYPNLWQTG
jgi:diguanylate cyclase (GGDEF)-like protein/PAS domain S-box-containing protein